MFAFLKNRLYILIFTGATLAFLVAITAAFIHFKSFSNKPSVILITIDALRPDHLSCYGYEMNTSPNIDRLARQGVLFREAVSQASWTRPSIRSLTTSTYPSTHGVYFFDQDLPDSMSTLQQILKGKGYSTGLISAHGAITEKGSVFWQGFDTLEEDSSSDAGEITQKASRWLRRNQNKKFFLWLHYMDVHDRSLGFPQTKIFIDNITREEIDAFTLKYDEAISRLDGEINNLLKTLKELRLYKNTLIVFTADHGEEMCEHGFCFTHGAALWDSLIRVPLIIFYPSLFPGGKLIIQQVQHIDIVPTICDILKIKKSENFEGKSLLSLIKGRNIHSRYAFSEHIERENDLSTGDWVYTKNSIRATHWKLICTYDSRNKTYGLYNLKEDSLESNDLKNTEKDQFELLKREQDKWIERPKPSITSSRIYLDVETKDKLRSLGYMQ